MSDAEQIQVQEVPDQNQPESGEKAFLVRIRPRPSSFLNKTEPELFANAQLLLANGDYLLARNLFSFLLRKNLRDEKAMDGLGICFLKLKEITAAKKCFKALWEMHQRSRYAVYLGMCYLAEENEEAAFSLFQQVTDEASIEANLNFDFQKAYGNLLMAKERWNEAEQRYLKALELSPNSAGVMVNLGTLELQRNNSQKAETHFNKALSLDSKNSRAHFGMGLVCWEGQQTSEAKQSFEKALDCDSKNTLALRYLIKVQESQANKENLKRRILLFLQQEPNNGEIRFQLARILMQENRFSEASDQADKALKLLPQDSRIQNLKKMLIQNRHWGTK
ncbi:MAG: tetratricopeptide repeat protein [Pseudomonadota bacterium]